MDKIRWPYILGKAMAAGVARTCIPRLGERYLNLENHLVEAKPNNIELLHARLAYEKARLKEQSPIFTEISEALNALGQDAWLEYEQGLWHGVSEETEGFNLEDYEPEAQD